jgi:hypothetical protein
MNERVCGKCGFTYHSDQSHCPHCGARFVNPVLRSCLIGCGVVAGIVVLLFGACLLFLNQTLRSNNLPTEKTPPPVQDSPKIIRDNPGAHLDEKSLPSHPKVP